MEFGLEQVCDLVRAGSSFSNLVTDQFEAKFHYAIWSQTGPRLVADLLACARCRLDERPNSSSMQVCDQPRTCLQPDSVMEFGFNKTVLTPACKIVMNVKLMETVLRLPNRRILY